MNVADKIRKLLALAQSSNPNEAALAAAKAQELMVKFAIDEAEIRAKDPTHAVADEPVAAEAMEGGERRRAPVPTWQASLAEAMSRSFFCRVYYVPKGDIWMVGRKTDREAFRATYFYVRDQIARMCEPAWEERAPWIKAELEEEGKNHRQALGGAAIRWKRGFYMGAVSTVRVRLAETLKQLTAAQPGTAIVLADRQKGPDLAIEKMKLSRGSTGPSVEPTGYRQGQKAGWALNLDRRASPSKALND